MNNLQFDYNRLKNKNVKIKLNSIVLTNKKKNNKDIYYIDKFNIDDLFSEHKINLMNKGNNYYTLSKNKIIEYTFNDIIKSGKDKVFINEKNSSYFMINELDFLLTSYRIPYIYDRYKYIYDYICDELDNEFLINNICDFKDNKCISRRDLMRKNCKSPLIYGCCYTKGKVCKYLINNKCTIKCISCKLFTCRYLTKRKIKYKVNTILGLKLFFNRKQKSIIYNKLFTDENKFLEILIQKK